MKYLFWIVIAFLVTVSGYFVWQATMVPQNTSDQTANVDTGVKPGSTVYTYVNASADTIQVDMPKAGDVVGKEFSILGKAKGWYFEGSFPVKLLKPDGTVLAQGPAQAQGDWMQPGFVSFKIDLKVNDPNYIGPATVVLHNDNPSGLPEHDASVSYPITVEY